MKEQESYKTCRNHRSIKQTCESKVYHNEDMFRKVDEKPND